MKTGKMLVVLLLTCLHGAWSAFGVSMLTQNYQYDENGRLIAVTVPENPLLNERYRYDGSGNLVEKQLGERIYRMSYDGAHQLKSQEARRASARFTMTRRAVLSGRRWKAKRWLNTVTVIWTRWWK